jgi:prepilin-type processing-associated H-X9-DG protein
MQTKWIIFLPFTLLLNTAGADTKAPTVHLPATAKNQKIQLPPEIAVKFLVNGYNAGQLRTMSGWIVGAHDNERLAQVSQEFKDAKGANTLSLSDLHTEIKNDEAIVTGQVTLRDGLFNTLTQAERLRLQRDGDTWKIVPDTPESFFTNKERDFLLNLATTIAYPEVMLSKKETASCLSKAKLVALGWRLYQQDHEEEDKIGLTAATFKDELMPYIKDEQAFHCSSDEKDQVSFALNDNLTGMSWAKMDRVRTPVVGPNGQLEFDPTELELFDTTHRAVWNVETNKLVAFYEGSNQRLNFRHNGYAVVCLVDGHVQLVNEQQSRLLQWKP